MAKQKRCSSFCASECVDGYCPNARYEAADAMYDNAGLAEDMGFERIKCKDCGFNTGTCEECIFTKSQYCPKEGEKQ